MSKLKCFWVPLKKRDMSGFRQLPCKAFWPGKWETRLDCRNYALWMWHSWQSGWKLLCRLWNCKLSSATLSVIVNMTVFLKMVRIYLIINCLKQNGQHVILGVYVPCISCLPGESSFVTPVAPTMFSFSRRSWWERLPDDTILTLCISITGHCLARLLICFPTLQIIDVLSVMNLTRDL